MSFFDYEDGDFIHTISGSYNDLKEAITEYESNIKAAKEPLLFDFR